MLTWMATISRMVASWSARGRSGQCGVRLGLKCSNADAGCNQSASLLICIAHLINLGFGRSLPDFLVPTQAPLIPRPNAACQRQRHRMCDVPAYKPC